ncbi:hypothetical protein SAMN05421739_102595 [Pontibacter chinhatensis]|uniref:Uncharacterized protein n=1 Tax=Pontibacter chinhatensis TaxID=1436961 RepID=A0A1I2S2S6_9BACT|nr:hypothetical protein SAMN05421739_102595 [Pontibacter chinhatensis]
MKAYGCKHKKGAVISSKSLITAPFTRIALLV